MHVKHPEQMEIAFLAAVLQQFLRIIDGHCWSVYSRFWAMENLLGYEFLPGRMPLPLPFYRNFVQLA